MTTLGAAPKKCFTVVKMYAGVEAEERDKSARIERTSSETKAGGDAAERDTRATR